MQLTPHSTWERGRVRAATESTLSVDTSHALNSTLDYIHTQRIATRQRGGPPVLTTTATIPSPHNGWSPKYATGQRGMASQRWPSCARMECQRIGRLTVGAESGCCGSRSSGVGKCRAAAGLHVVGRSLNGRRQSPVMAPYAGAYTRFGTSRLLRSDFRRRCAAKQAPEQGLAPNLGLHCRTDTVDCTGPPARGIAR